MDWTLIYIIASVMILPIMIYGLYAQSYTMNIFNKYSTHPSSSGITAEALAKQLLSKAGITDVRVERINGRLTDCYNPRHKVIKLSTSTSGASSIAALGVCAHEIGHAIQHAKGNFLFKLRNALVPVCNFISRAFLPLILIGSIMNFTFYIPAVGYYICLGSLISYGASLVFQLVTLPLEFDASKKAIALLRETELFPETELKQSKQVLNAAAQTYIASMLTTLVYFLRFLSYAMIFARDRD